MAKTIYELPWYIGEGNRLYDRHEQLEVLFYQAYLEQLPTDPELYWEIVGEVWKRTEFPYFESEAWLTIFSQSPGPNRYTKEWLKKPQMVYRGIDKFYLHHDCDWSWTTDYDKAVWFAKRNSLCHGLSEPFVKEFDVNKDINRVWCVFEEDPEHEVLLWSPFARELIEEY